jgi:NADPH-dependent 2,4-dienoyl-CoA reductase/sulfur reductase-like enzyme/rhodanese-related sulfurtransferase
MIRTLVVIGGVAGGATAATRARRLSEDAEIIVFEQGKYASFANCGLPYYIGGKIEKREKLIMMTPERFQRRWNINLRTQCEVLSIDRKKKEIEVKDHSSKELYRQAYDKLILSPGAQPLKPPIPGVESEKIFTLRTLPDADSILTKIQGGDVHQSIVVGAGSIGLEMAENLKIRGLEVSLVDMLSQVLPPLDPEMAVHVQSHLKKKGVSLHLGATVDEFSEDDVGIAVKLRSSKVIRSDFVILAAGVKPEVDLARKARLEIGVHGGICVNDFLETSDHDIFAIGDAVEVKHLVTGERTLIPLAGPAAKQARIAADNVFGRRSSYHGTLGTSVVKVFDLTVGFTGANEKTLKAVNMPYKKVYIRPASHANYYPGADFMSLKLLFSPDRGRILGAQVVGGAGVDKRVDVLATAIQADLTVYDLEELELAYSPPYGSVKDPINMVGYVAANDLKGDVDVIHAAQLKELDSYAVTVLDVRTVEEYGRGHIEGAKHIQLDELRKRLEEIPRDKPVVVYCETGQRSYYAYRILRQQRFKVLNLSGGIQNYSAVEDFNVR